VIDNLHFCLYMSDLCELIIEEPIRSEPLREKGNRLQNISSFVGAIELDLRY
jgi:hypothetical protein